MNDCFVFHIFTVCFPGQKDGEPIACETAKKEIEKKIEGIDLHEKYMTHQHDERDENCFQVTDQNELLNYVENNECLLSLNEWIDDIKKNVEITIGDSDDGDRDNLMYSPKFAKHFLRLCKLLPLWWGVSCQIFASPSVTSSSANVESYFNELKHRTMKDLIPCSPDVFVQNHMDATDDAVITASRKYAKPIEPIVARKDKETTANVVTKESEHVDVSFDADDLDLEQWYRDNEPDFITEALTPKSVASPDKNKTVYTCVACKDGNFPTDAHTCIECAKNIHIFDGCSVSIGSEEGYGSKRLCIACHKKQQTEAQDAKEMQYEEQWGKKKTKQSKFMQPNPLFSLMSNTKKQAIGLLKNGNQFKRPFYVDKKPIQLFNTCAPDALAQAIAGAYAYHHEIRAFYDKEPDVIVKIAISLAKK